MKIITYNVNGVRANLSKSKDGLTKVEDPNESCLAKLMSEEDPDILALQETRCPDHCLENELFSGFAYKRHEGSKVKAGYSGVAVFSKMKPKKDLTTEFPKELNEEGRLIALEYDKFYFICTYTPNTKPDLSRLEFRTRTWEPAVRAFINQIKKGRKPVIFVSDFNVAPTQIDIYTTKGKDKANGFTPQERASFGKLQEECELLNSFRQLHPTERKYSWFSPILNKRRALDKGWLIDMIMISKTLKNKLSECDILSDYWGSDHKPVYATFSL